MQIDVRIKLDRLHVVRKNESADEPYLWTMFLKFDGSTANLMAPDQAEIDLRAPSGAHHNLGKPSEGVVSAESIPIPSSIGEWKTTLRGFDFPIELTQFATLAIAVAGLEEDQTTDTHAIEAHRRIVDDARTRLNREIRRIFRDILRAIQGGGPVPDQEDIEDRLRDQVTADRIREIIDGLKDDVMPFAIAGAFFNPIAAIGAIAEATDPDDRLGYSIPEPFTFPRILGNSLTGIEIDLDLTKDQTMRRWFERFGVELPPGVGETIMKSEEGKYRVTGKVQRLDIKEPPTLAALWRGNGRIAVYGRGPLGGVYYHTSANRGTEWDPNRRVGNGLLSSGPAAACSADGSRIFVAGRGLDHRFWISLPAGGGKPGERWSALFDKKFISGPGIATSRDGMIVWVAGTSEDRHLYFTSNAQGGKDWGRQWTLLSGDEFLTSPSLACGADGRKLHVAVLGKDRRIKHGFSNNAGHFPPKLERTLGGTWVSAPSCACSADGSILWIAALADDHRLRIRRLENSGNDPNSDWNRFGTRFVSAPALTCSSDGKEVHIFAIGEDLVIRHRFTTDSGAHWSNWDSVRGGAWF